MNSHAQTFDEADFDSLFANQRTMEGTESLLSTHSFPQYPDCTYPPYSMPTDVLSMTSWQPNLPSFATPSMLDTRNISPRLASEMSPQSAFSNGSYSQADFEEPTSATSARTRKSRKKSVADASLDGSPATCRTKASKRKSSTATSLPGGGREGDDSSRQALLERNRIAASKCRERKKVANAELEEQSRSMGAENAYLRATEAALRHELLELKYKCLEHSNCDCEEIREYMKRQALHQSPTASLASFSPENVRRRSSTEISHAMTETPDTEITSNSSNPMSPIMADAKKPSISGRSDSLRRF